ncbi:hypothetical protein ABZP36_020711 [Zizania latifolia]
MSHHRVDEVTALIATRPPRLRCLLSRSSCMSCLPPRSSCLPPLLPSYPYPEYLTWPRPSHYVIKSSPHHRDHRSSLAPSMLSSQYGQGHHTVPSGRHAGLSPSHDGGGETEERTSISTKLKKRSGMSDTIVFHVFHHSESGCTNEENNIVSDGDGENEDGLEADEMEYDDEAENDAGFDMDSESEEDTKFKPDASRAYERIICRIIIIINICT